MSNATQKPEEQSKNTFVCRHNVLLWLTVTVIQENTRLRLWLTKIEWTKMRVMESH